MGWKKLLPLNSLVIVGFLLLIGLFSPISNVKKSAFAQSCYDINKFTTGSGKVYLDQDRSKSTSAVGGGSESCAGTGSTTNNVKINVDNLCPDFPDDYSTYPSNCSYSLTTYKDTTGYTWSCTPPSGWICGYNAASQGQSSVNTSWATSPWTLDWWARPNVTCSISGPSEVCPNTPVSYTLSCSGATPAGYYRCGTSGCSWQSLPNPVSLAPGVYIMTVNSAAVGGVACTGNPDCWFNGGSSQCAGYFDCNVAGDAMGVGVNSTFCSSPTPEPTVVPRPTMSPTHTPTGTPTRTPTRTPTPAQALSVKLTNSGFETDSDGKVGPDFWTSDSRFTRYSGVKRSGSYSGRHKATDSDGTSYVIYQAVSGILAGKGYNFSGYVKIPETADSFSFKLQVRWLNSNGSTINTNTIKTYSGETSGWNLFDSGNITAPVGATSARITMNVVGLNAIVYVDDFNFFAN